MEPHTDMVKYPWMVSDERAYQEWKAEKAWDLTDDEVRETFGDISSIAKDYKWDKFEDWFIMPKTINEENFGEAVCNEVGGIWVYDPNNRAKGDCVVLDVADILFHSIKIKEEGEYYPSTEFVTDLYERKVRLSKRMSTGCYINIHVDDAQSMEAFDVDFRVGLGDRPYVSGYARKHKAVTSRCIIESGKKAERGLCVSVSPMDKDDEEINSKINDEVAGKWIRKEPFFIEKVTSKYNRPKW